jgi:hypothetical protein
MGNRRILRPLKHRHLELTLFGGDPVWPLKAPSRLLARRATMIHQLVNIFLLHVDFLATMLASFPDLTIQTVSKGAIR